MHLLHVPQLVKLITLYGTVEIGRILEHAVMSQKPMKQGFTLIEMLVSIGIVMIIFSVGIASSYKNATAIKL